MEKFQTVSSVAAPLPMVNVDTDKIFPARFLKTIERSGLGKYAFRDLRYTEGETEDPNFVLNQPAYRDAKILITGANFGCGSSREHAPWALYDMGIRCIIGPSFADIFFNNCFKNGILTIKMPTETVDALMTDAQKGSNTAMTVDLEDQIITRPGERNISFEIDPFRKYCLMNGLDEIGLTLRKEDKIKAFEVKRAAATPWLEQTLKLT